MRRNHLPTVTMPSLRTNRRTDPANSGLFVLFQEISGSIRLRGGPGVVPRHSDFNNLDCQMALSTITSTGSRFEGDLFADFYPPQTFALRADATLGNERQMVGRSGRARCKRSQRLQTRSRVRTTLQGCATLPPTWTDARLAPRLWLSLARGSKGTFLPISIRRKLLH